jgi:Core-2/I-Branching enzyme
MLQETFKLGIVVLAHRRPQQLATLLGALRHPQVTTYLHIDSKSQLEPFEAAFAAADLGEIVWLDRHRSSWGSLEIVDAELEGISRALADDCSYILLISGEDFPLRPIAEIVEFAQANEERSYVDAAALPYDGWDFDGRHRTDFYSYKLFDHMYTCIPRGEDTSQIDRKRRLFNWVLRLRSMPKPDRRFPRYLSAFGGQQWLNLSAPAAEYVLAFVESHPDYREYHKHTACPDEMFIQSILMGSDFATTHEIVNDDLRFLVWEGGDHPRTLTLDDLPAILASSDLFARKVIGEQDPELLAALEDAIGSVP